MRMAIAISIKLLKRQRVLLAAAEIMILMTSSGFLKRFIIPSERAKV